MTRSKLGDPGKIYDLSLEPNQLGIGFKNSNFHTKKETCRWTRIKVDILYKSVNKKH